jgi:hypothetical protein
MLKNEQRKIRSYDPREIAAASHGASKNKRLMAKLTTEIKEL